MKLFYKIGLSLNIVLFMVSCTTDLDSNIARTSDIDSAFVKVKTISVDSLSKASIEWRSYNLLTIRSIKGIDGSENVDSIENMFAPILLKIDKNKLKFKHINNWIDLDSIGHYFPLKSMDLSIDHLVYYYNIMETLGIQRIGHFGNNCALYISIDNLEYFYITDSKYFLKYNIKKSLKKLDGNWWVKRKYN